MEKTVEEHLYLFPAERVSSFHYRYLPEMPVGRSLREDLCIITTVNTYYFITDSVVFFLVYAKLLLHVYL